MIPERFNSIAPESCKDPLVRSLLEDGYAVLKAALPTARMLAMSRALDDRFELTPFSVGHFHGERTKRFHRLLARCEGAQEVVLQPEVLDVAQTILSPWCDFPELNLTQGVEIHPGAPAQIPHADHNMWPVPKGAIECSINVVWPMVPFHQENGATRVWPRSHLSQRDPDSALPPPIVHELEPGDALLILGSTVHAAGANRTSAPRRALIISYCLGWLKAYENQSLAYPLELVRGFPDELQKLLGYRWHRPNLGTYDGQCPSVLLGAKVPDHLATIDALSPEHQRVLQKHLARPPTEIATRAA